MSRSGLGRGQNCRSSRCSEPNESGPQHLSGVMVVVEFQAAVDFQVQIWRPEAVPE